jgi:hypothetical protein
MKLKGRVFQMAVLYTVKNTLLKLPYHILIFNPWLMRDTWEGSNGKGDETGRENSHPPSVLFFYNCFDRAYLGATSAFRTFLFIDHIGLSLFNSFSRTFFCTSPASHTFIGDHISHRHHPLYP